MTDHGVQRTGTLDSRLGAHAAPHADEQPTGVGESARAVFLLVWFVGIVMLTVARLRLPSVVTLLFLLVDAMGVASGATALPMGRPLLAGR